MSSAGRGGLQGAAGPLRIKVSAQMPYCLPVVEAGQGRDVAHILFSPSTIVPF